MKSLKILLVVFLVAVAAAAGFAAYVPVAMERRLHRQIEVTVVAPTLPTEPTALAHGEYLYKSRGCAECHGANGGGKIAIKDGDFVVKTPDISSGGVVAQYTTLDWARALRHGVKPNGTPMLIMPCEDYNQMTQDDLGALVAYTKALPPAGGTPAEFQLPFAMQVLYVLGQIPDAPEKIDHALPPPEPVPAGETVEHGRYVANLCVGCHGKGLSGGKIPGMPPDFPEAANLTPGEKSSLVRYQTADQFVALMRERRRPDGSPFPAGTMPFETFAYLSDTDLRALYAFLKALPPRPAGSR